MANLPGLIAQPYNNGQEPAAPQAALPTTTPVAPAAPAATPITAPATSPTATGQTPASTTQPAAWNVDSNQTVAGQVKNIIAENSPLMQQAQTAGARYSNQRGLMNSSMGALAAQEAVYKAALPMATSDAAMHGESARFNADQSNQFTMKNTDINAQKDRDLLQQGFTVTNKGIDQANTQANMGLAQTFDLAKMDKQAGIAMGMFDAQTQADMTKMAVAQGYNLATMTAQQVNDLAKASIMQGYTQSNMGLASQITLSHMSAAQLNDLEKMAASQGYNLETMSAQQVNDLAKAAVLQGYDLAKMDADTANALTKMDAASVLDLQKLAVAQGYSLETMSAQQVLELERMAQANVLDLEKMGAANGYTIDQMKEATTQDLLKMAEAAGYDLEAMAAKQGFDIATMDKQQLFDLAKMDKTYTQADKEAQAKFGYDKDLMEIQKSSNIEIAGIEANYRSLIQASASATSLSNAVSQNINQILLNENLDAAAKQTAIDQVKTNYANSLQLIGAMSGDVDLSNFVDSLLGVAPAPAGPTAPDEVGTPEAAQAYFAGNPDVADAYASNSYGMTPEQFAAYHYQNFGQAEGRTSPIDGYATTQGGLINNG